ncbi:D-amino acid aminotransferase [Noviherbaspirillum sp.]|uniref:D-amino acid aminotransferase n=1 Tax=Noviherbaspirillum sp. TaxID=1926288 RepID=UPI002D2254B0|nr:D-amino acid aminotransferase [Noviherbaspirillum sp.]HZW23531.1 D-amino acid aminotransferase [Noviherbaspirillum sp.]
MHDPLVYLNGEFTPLSEAKVPVLDRGFIFGDGVYEVIPIYGGKMFRAKQHMARLFRSLAAIGIPNPYSEDEWMALIGKVTDACPDDTQLVYMQVTRGVAKRAHAFPAEVKPTVFIMTNPYTPPDAEAVNNGVRCVTTEDLRWMRCDIKSVSLLGNVLAAQHAAENGALEAIQFREGFLSEGASSNVWIVRDGTVYGPPKDNRVLEGIRYGLLQELCAACRIPFALKAIARDEVFAADEVLLTSAGREVLAVVSIDGLPVNGGKPGPLFGKLYAAYQDAKRA